MSEWPRVHRDCCWGLEWTGLNGQHARTQLTRCAGVLVCVLGCVLGCVRARVRACVRARVRACVCVCVCVRAQELDVHIEVVKGVRKDQVRDQMLSGVHRQRLLGKHLF